MTTQAGLSPSCPLPVTPAELCTPIQNVRGGGSAVAQAGLGCGVSCGSPSPTVVHQSPKSGQERTCPELGWKGGRGSCQAGKPSEGAEGRASQTPLRGTGKEKAAPPGGARGGLHRPLTLQQGGGSAVGRRRLQTSDFFPAREEALETGVLQATHLAAKSQLKINTARQGPPSCS